MDLIPNHINLIHILTTKIYFNIIFPFCTQALILLSEMFLRYNSVYTYYLTIQIKSLPWIYHVNSPTWGG
jgi:hypothetical protein